ncbi:bacterioferritin [Endozoicomonadaceae bacterium StTr2]
MKGNKHVITHLSKALSNELVAINQYFMHARILKDQGLTKLADKIYHESIDEMHHADWLIERILFLDAMPDLGKLGALNIGKTAKEMLDNDLKLETEAIPVLKEGIAICESHSDYGSRDLLDKILTAEEAHIDWLEQQQSLIEKMGIKNYTMMQAE